LAFFPKGGLVAEQANAPVGSGRVASLPTALHDYKRQPLVGQGMGTRVAKPGEVNTQILDDQWLGTLVETGLVGALSFVWLFRRALSRLARAAKRDDSPRGWLYTALAASIAAFAVGMFTYDAFAFIQVTIVMYILLGFAGAALNMAQDSPA
jgi:O-antigen ligase